MEPTMRSFLAGAFLAAIAGTATWSAPASAQEIKTYCTKVGNDDRLQALPSALTATARRIFEVAAETPDSYVKAATSVRCMSGTVWLCNRGANLVCGKAN